MLFGEGQCVISTLFYHAMCSRGAMAVPDEEVEEVFKLFDQAQKKGLVDVSCSSELCFCSMGWKKHAYSILIMAILIEYMVLVYVFLCIWWYRVTGPNSEM